MSDGFNPTTYVGQLQGFPGPTIDTNLEALREINNDLYQQVRDYLKKPEAKESLTVLCEKLKIPLKILTEILPWTANDSIGYSRDSAALVAALTQETSTLSNPPSNQKDKDKDQKHDISMNNHYNCNWEKPLTQKEIESYKTSTALIAPKSAPVLTTEERQKALEEKFTREYYVQDLNTIGKDFIYIALKGLERQNPERHDAVMKYLAANPKALITNDSLIQFLKDTASWFMNRTEIISTADNKTKNYSIPSSINFDPRQKPS